MLQINFTTIRLAMSNKCHIPIIYSGTNNEKYIEHRQVNGY